MKEERIINGQKMELDDEDYAVFADALIAECLKDPVKVANALGCTPECVGKMTDEDFEHIAEELADDLEYTYEEILHMSEEEMYQVSDKIVEKFYENYSGGKKMS